MEVIESAAKFSSGEIIFAMIACTVLGMIISFYIISKTKNNHR